MAASQQGCESEGRVSTMIEGAGNDFYTEDFSADLPKDLDGENLVVSVKRA